MGLTDLLKYGFEAVKPDKSVEFLEGEVEYLSNEVRRLEIENYELRQDIRLLEMMLEDLQIGQPKGELN